MKKPLLIAGGLFGALCIAGVIAALQSQTAQQTKEETTRTTTITNSTEKTKEEAQSTRDKENNTEKLPEKAAYVDYDEDTFSAHSSRTRVLFFFDSSHAASVSLDKLITESLSKLPDDVSVFKTTLNDSPDEAKTLGVTEPGVAISFTHDTQLMGAYVAPEQPDLATFIAILGLKSQ